MRAPLSNNSHQCKHAQKSLNEMMIEPTESTNRNPFEQPLSLGEEDFTRRASGKSVRVYKSPQEETMSLTEDIVRVEKEIE
jgi:hypothetical protein